MQPPHNPYGPYAPPAQYPPMTGYGQSALYRQNVLVPPGSNAGPLVGTGLSTAKLVVGVVQLLGLFATVIFIGAAILISPEGRPDGTLMGLGVAAMVLWYLALIAFGILNLVWLYKFWSWIPPEQRYTPIWKKYISPGMAIGFSFIPYFNIYWMFVLYLGIADILERMRVMYPVSKGPAKNLALLRLIGGLVFFPALPILDYLFGRHVQAMAAEMHARMHAR